MDFNKETHPLLGGGFLRLSINTDPAGDDQHKLKR